MHALLKCTRSCGCTLVATQVSHQGESFYGPWPVRLLVQLHAYYVTWATEKHINSPVRRPSGAIRSMITLGLTLGRWLTCRSRGLPWQIFGTEDMETQEHQRGNIPLHVAREFIDTLRAKQEDEIKTRKLARKNTMAQEQNLEQLKKLQRMDTALQLSKRGGKVHIADPEAQRAIRGALKDMSQADGPQAAAKAMNDLVSNKDVKWTKLQRQPTLKA